MTDTRNTPDEPDERGTVTTEHTAAGNGAAAGDHGAGDHGAAGGDHGAAGGANGHGSEADGEPPRRPSPGPRPPGEDGPAPVPGAPGEVPVAAVPETPAPGNGSAGAEAAGAPSSRPGPDPAPPAPGPVPGPGPGAAAPPPWLRMPGSPEPTAPPARNVESDLLDNIPTAFVEPAGPPGGGAAPGGPAPGGPTRPGLAERTGWTSVRTRVRPPRRAALQLKRLDPWSVLKLALVLSGVLFLIWLVAAGLLYGVLDGMGVWDRLNGTYSDLVAGEGGSGGETLISAWRVLGTAALFGFVNSVLFAVALTVGAFVYNVSADLVGGIEVTLSERD